MAGPVANMADIWKKKPFKYTPPSPPAELIESTSYTIDFTNRKFVHIGIDPTENFQVVIRLLTSSRYVNISPDFLRRIFSLMGNILSFVLEQPEKYRRTLFLETEFNKLSSMMYSGENVLVIESKNHEGCRILLNRSDLIQLQNLEWCIFETVARKSTTTQPAVLKQFDMFLTYIDDEFTNVKSPPKTNEQMIIFIKNLSDDKIIRSTPKEEINFISQLKINATIQLAEHWARRWNEENSQESCYADPKILSPSCPPKPIIYSLQDDSCTIRDAFDKPEDKILAKPLDHIDGIQSPSCPRFNIRDGFDLFNRFDSPTSTYVNHLTAAPLRGVKRRLPQSPASPQPFDVNDGPDFFNPIGTSTPYFNPIGTSTPCQPTFTHHPAPIRDVRRQLF